MSLKHVSEFFISEFKPTPESDRIERRLKVKSDRWVNKGYPAEYEHDFDDENLEDR